MFINSFEVNLELQQPFTHFSHIILKSQHLSAGRQISIYFDLNIYCNVLNSQSCVFSLLFESWFFFFYSSHVLKGNSKLQSCILILETKIVELSCVYRTVPKALCCCSVHYIFITLKKIHNNV